MFINVKKLNKIYNKYGYEINATEIGSRISVFILRQGMYYGADIVPLAENIDTTEIENELTNSGFTCAVRNYNSEEDAEDLLFDGFFNTKMISYKISKKYEDFTHKQIKHLGKNAEYKYINSPYKVNNLSPVSQLQSQSIITDVINLVADKGPKFIIIEAAAGFGKTCTAYEILNELNLKYPSKNPLFAELSRNRHARIFKYVLLSEIEEEFNSSVNSDLVTHHIKSGRIPLIIDGFDELLSRDQQKKESNSENINKKSEDYEQIETMISTIGDLLDSDAKVILTSRKTAIFSGEEFNKWVDKCSSKFEIHRFNIDNPNIKDWLSKEQLDLIFNKSKLPIKHVANPVLLAYLKNLKIKEFASLIEKPETIIEKYFNSMLEREQERQNLLIKPEVQLNIFKNLAVLFTELNITSEEKYFVKELIIDYNKDILNKTREKYPLSSRPTLDELADTLTNHALLDRIGSKGNNIGFINDFVFGILIGYCLNDKNYIGTLHQIPENIAELIVTAFQFHNKAKRVELWKFFDKSNHNYSKRFKLLIDLKLKNIVQGEYCEEAFDFLNFEDLKFDTDSTFSSCIFTGCKFYNSTINMDIFSETTFINCYFENCIVVKNEKVNYSGSIFVIDCMDDNNGFLEKFYTDKFEKTEELEIDDLDDKNSLQILILEKFFKVDHKTTRINYINSIKNEFGKEQQIEVLKEIKNLQKMGFIIINGKIAFLTNKGTMYYSHNKLG